MRASLLLVLLCAGCPGVLEDPDRFRGEFCPDIESELFPQSCATGDCHDAIEPAALLDLQSPNVVARISGTQAMGDECFQQGTLLVPGNPQMSLIYLKLTEAPPCGAQMPFIGDRLSEREIGCVATWIEGLDNVSTVDAGTSD